MHALLYMELLTIVHALFKLQNVLVQMLCLYVATMQPFMFDFTLWHSEGLSLEM
jgi:hypothetical protein